MKKRGFTLIELLAVIVVLAIIALIATPIVMNLIENSKKGAAERSAENYLRAVETAVASERINGPVTDGEYQVDENGDLVLQSDNTIKIEVDVNGTLPEEGTIVVIVNGLVDKTQVAIVIGDYTVSYDAEGKIKVEETVGGTTVTKICRPATAEGDDAVTTGNVPTTGEYNYGDEYICDPGDGIERRFFVLENIESSENISLIMDRNFTDEVVPSALAWCIDDVANDTKCKNINSTEEGTPLKHIQDTFGNNVEVSFPTYEQIIQANGGTNSNLQTWLYDYLNRTTHPVSGVYAYWTASPNGATPYDARIVHNSGNVGNGNVVYQYRDFYGVRPVITIPKTELN